MKNIAIILLLLLQYFILSETADAQDTTDELLLKNRVDDYLSQGVHQGFSGAVLIAKEGRILLDKGYGMADRENEIPYTSKTIATIGSVTKQFTAAAILILEEQGKLEVTDPLSKFFKKLPDDKRDITIHQLLTHTSGLVPVVGEDDFDDVSMKRFFKMLFSSELLHNPGSNYAYSNTGYSVLARIIEIISDVDYESFLRDHLFLPAGMHQTGYFMPDWDEQMHATGYARGIVNVGTTIARLKEAGEVTWSLKGNGGIQSTSGDMYKWYMSLKTNKVLSSDAIDKLVEPYVKENEDGESHYAYGWAIYCSDRNTKIISHNGGNAMFFHDFIWLPEEDAVVILFTNATSKEVEVAWPIEKMIFDETFDPKPIRKSLFPLTFDYMQKCDVSEVNGLIAIIKEDYSGQIKRPYELNGLGYRILKNEIREVKDNTAWATAIFKLNTELFPTVGNIWDSLGESYMKNNQKEEAIKSYEMALSLAPEGTCSYCKGARKMLRKLRKG